MSTILRKSIACALACSPLADAQIHENFDDTASGYCTAIHKLAVAPEVKAGPTGKYLLLAPTSAAVPIHNTLAFPAIIPAGDVAIDFDFRMVGSADGFGVTLLDVSKDECTTGGDSEEPAFSNSLGIGFDIINNSVFGSSPDVDDNHISIYFNNALIKQVMVSSIDLNGGEFIHAEIDLTYVGGQARLSVRLQTQATSEVVFLNEPVPAAPYASRLHVGARCGGGSADHCFDNFMVDWPSANPPTFSFTDATFTGVEQAGGSGRAVLTIVRDGDLSGAQQVSYSTLNGTAGSSDFVSTSGQASFAAGEWYRHIEVPLVDDAASESVETFSVQLSSPTAGAVLGIPSTATVTIVDDDDPAAAGRWDAPFDLGIVAVHMHVLPSGDVMYWRGEGNGGAPTPGSIRRWSPATGAITATALPTFDIFCSGHAFTEEGRLFVAGGNVNAVQQIGLKEAALYDPEVDSWTNLPLMNCRRWYPTTTTLPNGDMLVISGDQSLGVVCALPQVWASQSSQWLDLVGATKALPLYPFMAVAPNGMVFNSGPQPDTAYLHVTDTSNPAGLGSWVPVGSNNFGERHDGGSVYYDHGRILLTGGATGELLPTRSCEVIDLLAGNPAWSFTGSMSFARHFHNSTILADGTVLITGGSESPGFNDATGAVLAAEIWNPSAGTYRTVAAAATPRVYHSTSVLLPDGRVLVAGGGEPAATGGADNKGGEIYSPPYLFQGPRPIVTEAPSSVAYGSDFFVKTPSAAAITDVLWIRLPSTTHAYDHNQRLVRLPYAVRPTGILATSPADGATCPPGTYMMFLVNGNGVPSVASMIAIDHDPWHDLRCALDGSAGPPQLSGSGTLTVGSNVTLTLTNAPPNAPAWLIVGVSGLGLPLFGGLLFPNPSLVAAIPSTSATGDLVLSGSWVAGTQGLTVYFQYYLLQGAPVAYAASNALAATPP